MVGVLVLAALLASIANATEIAHTDSVDHATTQTVNDDSVTYSEVVLSEEPSQSEGMFNIGHLISILAILVPAFVVLAVADRQFRRISRLQREGTREKLKLEIYAEYKQAILRASDSIADVATFCRLTVPSLALNVDLYAEDMAPIPLSESESDFRKAHYAAIESLVELTIVVEQYEIVDPNLAVFRMAFSHASYCMVKAFSPLQAELFKYLPYDVPLEKREEHGLETTTHAVPSRDDLIRVENVAGVYEEAIVDAGCYVYDLAIEAQNIFLGGLFDHRLEGRKPTNPKYVVITSDPKDLIRLTKYFNEETSWAKQRRNAEERLRAEVENREDQK